MTTLIACTALSPLFVRIIVNELMRDSNTLVVDTTDQVHAELERLNIPSIHLAPNVKFDWAERDESFRELFMRGPQLQQDFPDTHLPVWKVTALDRFSFWFTYRDSAELYDMIMALNWDRAIVPADLNSDLAWTLARYSGRPVWAVKTGGFRNREWFDLLSTGNIPFSGIYVGNDSDMKFLSNFGTTIKLLDFDK